DLGGLERMVKEKGYAVIDRDSASSPEERAKLQHEALSCGTFLTGANAISEDGQLVNIDGMGNRIAAMIYGPRQVIVIAGMNKVVKTADDAIQRARTVAAPLNAQRFDTLKTPCAKTGSCADCKSPDSICTYIVTTRLSKPAGRIKVLLIGEDLGL
ncbi:MAG: lactate utilization protein, partial [Spirochaetaceae bacterium]|nr:lactate utilization protein [Spirochaetaceae bacterium]